MSGTTGRYESGITDMVHGGAPAPPRAGVRAVPGNVIPATAPPVLSAEAGEAGPQPLVVKLAAALDAVGLRYCQWKGRAKRARWAAGVGDVDLLVDRAAAPDFTAALDRLGFSLALAPEAAQVPGVLSYLGHDPYWQRLIHVHVHFQLIIGRPWATHFRLPIEQAVLDSAVAHDLFRSPTPEFELLLFGLTLTLRHSVADLFRARERRWLRRARFELELLEEAVDREAMRRLITHHFRDIDPVCFERCLASLRYGCPASVRLAARYMLERRLRAHSARASAITRLRYAAASAAARIGLAPGAASGSSKRLLTGGAVIALVGADGAGKSTCARLLETWLACELRTRRAHLGRPPRSAATFLMGGTLKVVQWLVGCARRPVPSSLCAHLELLRCLCTARDRYRLCRRLWRAAARGVLVICERYPIPENRALVGPSADQEVALAARTRFAAWLRRRERTYYARMTPPDVILVLRVDPETAVLRKPEEPANYVRARAGILWDVDWSRSRARLIDAGQPLAQVMAELSSHVWSAI